MKHSTRKSSKLQKVKKMKTWKLYTKEEIARLKKYWESGMTVKDIGKKFSKTRTPAAITMKINVLQHKGILKFRHMDGGTRTKKVIDNTPKSSGDTPEWVKAAEGTWPNPFRERTQELIKDVLDDSPQQIYLQRMSTKINNKCAEIKTLLLTKNRQYGDSVSNPIRVFSKADINEQLKVRIDDKLSRLVRGNDSIESDEDVIKDLIGYLILLLIQYETQAKVGENN
jgi:hypothetical protein